MGMLARKKRGDAAASLQLQCSLYQLALCQLVAAAGLGCDQS
jgi:hypothetical protein